MVLFKIVTKSILSFLMPQKMAFVKRYQHFHRKKKIKTTDSLSFSFNGDKNTKDVYMYFLYLKSQVAYHVSIIPISDTIL